MTITVSPVNVQVKGQTFQPKDINGKDVPVFAYNGSTYAPLRALATAYGLEVGYDSSTNTATVAEPDASTPTTPSTDYSTWSTEDKVSYQEFKGLWEFVPMGDSAFDRFVCVGGTTENLKKFLLKIAEDKTKMYVKRLSEETFKVNSEKTNMMFFYFCGVDLGDYLWYTTCYSDGVRENQFEQDKVLKMISL